MKMLQFVSMLKEYVTWVASDFIFKWHSLVPWKVWTCSAESSVICVLTDCKWKEEDGLSLCVPLIGTCCKMKMCVLIHFLSDIGENMEGDCLTLNCKSL